MFFFNLSLILTFIAQTSETFCSDGFTPLLVVKCDIENVYIEVNENCRKAEFRNRYHLGSVLGCIYFHTNHAELKDDIKNRFFAFNCINVIV